ncbi:transcription repressor NadR [Clostridium vincentii]|uniref:Putative transcription repressor NiaR n=1 Tax=Clostridium vincentii TaxID=52704 RepID=A0A2T0BCI9_9CLOT|nr:transcription repressor NadR [Clostridium vincentii]PRR81552.1 putative transcription repressor NiaR [Clostridium vincentii]
MNSIERREDIIKLLISNNKALKGTVMADSYRVTRQIIVKDIAILRAKGNKIIATPDGYIIGKEDNRIKQIIAVTHDESKLGQELNIVIKYGGIIEDVIVEHPLYGEIKGMLMIKNLNDLEKFLINYKKSDAKLLSLLTKGVHIHTISADTESNMKLILEELNKNGFIIDEY